VPSELPPEPTSFFAERYFLQLIGSLRQPGAAEPWLGDALALLVENVDCFPPPEDEDSYIVEYIYPH
jgi:hypothetical protein